MYVYIYSRYGRSSRFSLCVSSRCHVGRKISVLFGQIRYCLVTLFLATALLWVEPEAVERGASGYSENKACSASDLEPPPACMVRLLPRGHHGDGRGTGAVDG